MRAESTPLSVLSAALGSLATVAAGSTTSVATILSAALVLMLVSASVHYVNEWADHETDALTVRTPFSGGSGTLPDTGLPRRLALVAGVATATLASASALVAMLVGLLLHRPYSM